MAKRERKGCAPLDFLAPSFSLNINGKSSYNTKTGMVLSLTCLGAFIFLIYFNVTQYLDKTRPRVSQELEVLANPPKIDFVKGKHFPIMFFYYLDSTPIDSIDELGKFAHVALELGYFKKDADGNEIYINNVLKPKRCSDLVAQGKTETIEPSNDYFVKSNYLVSGICFDSEGIEVSLGGATDGRYYESAAVNVYPCVLGDQCHPLSELAKLSFTVASPTVNLNLNNYKNPLLYLTEAEDYYYITPSIGSKHKMYLMKGEIREENGFLTPKAQPTSFSTIRNLRYLAYARNPNQITCSEEELYGYFCDPYYRLIYSNTYSQLVVTREYKGVIETISEIGGMIELILIVFSALYSFYHNEALRQYMILQIYGISKPKTPSRCISSMNKIKTIDADKEQQQLLYKNASERLEKDLDITWILRELKTLKLMLLKNGVQESGESEQEMARQQLLASIGKSTAMMFTLFPQSDDKKGSPLTNKARIKNKIMPLRIVQQKTKQAGKKKEETPMHRESFVADEESKQIEFVAKQA